MPDLIEIIAVPHKDRGGTADDLTKVAQAVIDHEQLILVKASDIFVSFTGPPEAIDEIKELFSDNMLFEENKVLQMVPPGPFGDTATPKFSTDVGDDKDEDDIVEF